MTFVFLIVGLLFWVWVIRAAARWGARHPRQLVLAIRGAGWLLTR